MRDDRVLYDLMSKVHEDATKSVADALGLLMMTKDPTPADVINLLRASATPSMSALISAKVFDVEDIVASMAVIAITIARCKSKKGPMGNEHSIAVGKELIALLRPTIQKAISQ